MALEKHLKKIILVLLLIMLAVPVTQRANEPEESLILYMSFDAINDKQVFDHSLYENHGEMRGAPKQVTGRFGKALQYNGTSDFIQIPHDESLTVDKDVTVMAWIHAETLTGPNDGRWAGILAKGNNPRSYSLWTDAETKCLHFSVGPPNGGGTVCNTEIKLNAWQHVSAQINEGTHRYWLNGELVKEIPNRPNPPGLNDLKPVVIGTASVNNETYFTGMIDEVRIWNRALSDEEINAQMEKGHFEIFAVDPRNKLTTTWGNLKVQQ